MPRKKFLIISSKKSHINIASTKNTESGGIRKKMEKNTCLTTRLMRPAILTAAVQETHGRQIMIDNPEKAALSSALTWIETARNLNVDIELAAALMRPDSYIPVEAFLDPVAPHAPLRTFPDGTGKDMSDDDTNQLIDACGSDVHICDLGFFDNPMHPDPKIRRQVYEHILRCGRAAQKLKSVGCTGVAGFIGSDPNLTIDQNIQLFERYVIPILKEFKKMGVIYYIEQCPMPGLDATASFYFNNIAYCAGMWILLYRVAQKHGVENVLRITYDVSHDILMGNTYNGSFMAMKAAGIPFMVARFHGKNQYRKMALVALWTMFGQRAGLGSSINGKPHPNPAECGKAWGIMTANHGMVGIGEHNPLAMFQGLENDWFGHQYDARNVLGMIPEDTYFVLEHEWGPARVQDLGLVKEMVQISAQYFRGIDRAADAQYRSKLWCADREIKLPGSPNPLNIFPGLDEAAQSLMAMDIDKVFGLIAI
ncbi:MAG: hypothetical protein WCV41_01045 [Patescibacteria group bacterium]